MPNGDTQERKESSAAHMAVIERLKSRRDMIATLPVEKQLDVYGVAFDRFAKPMYAKLGLKEKDLELAKDRWIVGVVSPERQKPLPEGFGGEALKHGYGTEASAELVGMGAGAMGGVKNFLDWLNKGNVDLSGKPTQGPARSLLAKGEEKGYKLAHDVSPGGAEFGAGVGHAIPAIGAFEVGAGAIPSVAQKAPLAWKMLSYLAKTTAGTAAMVTTEEKPTAGKVATQTAVNIAFDTVLRGLGKVGKLGASKVISRLKTQGSPAQQQAATAVEDMLTTVLKEKHPGKPLNDLTSAEFDAAVNEAKLRRSTIEQKAKEASKAVKEAKAAVKPSPEQKVIDKEALKAKKAGETKAKNEAARAFHKRLVDYKKRTGAIPPPDSQHMKDLLLGKTVEDLLGTPERNAVQAATGVANAHEAQAIQEGAPQAVEAVNAIKEVGGESQLEYERRTRGGVAKEIPETPEQIKAKEERELTAEAEKQLKASGVTPGKVADMKKDKEALLKPNIDAILKAESPADFSKAKKEAMQDIVDQARALAKTGKIDQQKLMSETNKARERIRSIEVPKTFSKKTLDAARKAKEAKGTAGSVAVEEVSSGAGKVASSADPETEMLRNEQLLDQLKDVSSEKSFAYVSEVIKKRGMSLKLQNDMIESAIEALKKAKK